MTVRRALRAGVTVAGVALAATLTVAAAAVVSCAVGVLIVYGIAAVMT
jgi:hypothetical protein